MNDVLAANDGLLVRVVLYLVVFWPTVGYYVYSDAKRRDLAHPGLRGAAYGFLGVVGLSVYLGRKGRSAG